MLITTQISNMESSLGPYVEGYLALTNQRLGFRSTMGTDFGFQARLEAIADVQPSHSPVSHHVGFTVDLLDGRVVAGSTSMDFVGILIYTVAMVRIGKPIHDSVSHMREALTMWGGRQ